MSNNFFQFKQFIVYHDQCAMKVGTDGVLLGAWTNVDIASNALDIGTGTGLIALMLAQNNNLLRIDAIDIDNNAIVQAKENIKTSPFSHQIECYHTSFQEFRKQTVKKYDLIVSNPPFFKESLKSPQHNRTLARHTDSLSIEELLNISSSLLTDTGRLSIIYPYEEKETILEEAEKSGLYPSIITSVLPTPTSCPKRILLEFSKTNTLPATNTIIIEEGRHMYSNDFIQLVKDFYLKL